MKHPIMEEPEECGRARKSARPTEAVGAEMTFLMCVMTWVFLRHTTDVRSDSGCPNLRNGRGVFVLWDNSRPTRLSVPMFFLS